MKILAAGPILTSILAAAVPFSLTSTYVDIGVGGQSYAVAADASGNLFTVSSAYEPSGRQVVRIIKTDQAGNVLAQMDYGAQATTPSSGYAGYLLLRPVAAAVDGQGNLVVVGNAVGATVPLVSALISSTTASAGFVAKFHSQLQQIVFSTRLGAAMTSFPTSTSAGGVAVDKLGNIYVTGATSSANFPVTNGAFQTSPPENDNFGVATFGYVAELTADGSRFVFSTFFGGNAYNCLGGSSCIGRYGQTLPAAIALDALGNIVIAGATSATDLTTTPGVLYPQCGCPPYGNAAFVAKFASGGRSLIWSTYFNSAPADRIGYDLFVNAVALDAQGNVLLGGNAPGGLATTTGSLQPDYPGGSQTPNAGFLAELNPSASQITWATYFGFGSVNAVMPDGNGGAWITGTSDARSLASFASTPVLGTTYVADLAAGGGSADFLMTAPLGGTGAAITAGPAVLGSAGSLLLPGESAVSLAGIANGALGHMSPYVAPYELVSFYGLNLGPTAPAYAQVVHNAVTSAIGGVQVTFNGVPAPLLYAGPTQINAVVPGEVAGLDMTQVQILSPNSTVPVVNVPVRPANPGIFTNGEIDAISGLPYAIALNQDGTVNSAANPALPATIIAVWGTGGGANFGSLITDGTILNADYDSAPALPANMIGDSLETVYAAGAPGDVVGVLQINFRLAPAKNDAVVQLDVGGVISDPILIHTQHGQ